MKQIALTCLAAFTLMACAAPQADETSTETVAPSFDRTSAEPQGKDAKPGAKNTYVKDGCNKQLTAKLAATTPVQNWNRRALQASAQNESLGLEPLSSPPQISRTVAKDGPPMPTTGNYRCNLMFDVSTGGEPTNIITHCTDPAFEDYAVSEIKSVRFVPAISSGKEVVRKGVVTDLTVCTTQ